RNSKRFSRFGKTLRSRVNALTEPHWQASRKPPETSGFCAHSTGLSTLERPLCVGHVFSMMRAPLRRVNLALGQRFAAAVPRSQDGALPMHKAEKLTGMRH